MKPIKKSIRLLSVKHAFDVHKLRVHGFSSAQGFIIHPDVARWSYKDDFFYNLGVFHGNELISVMRLDWAFDLASLQFTLNAKSLPEDLEFPAAVLVKASTHQDIRGGGYNALLRYWSLKIAEAWQVRHVLGTMVKDSPRVNSMAEMGYEFHTNPDPWRGYYHSDDEILVAVLDLQKKKKQVFSYLRGLLGEKLDEYKVEFDPHKVKMKSLPPENSPEL